MNNSSSLFYHASHAMLRIGTKLISNETDIEQPSSTSDESNPYLIWGLASLLLLVGGGIGCKYFLSLQQTIKPNRMPDRGEAIRRCREQVAIEVSEIDAITELMYQYNGELASFLKNLPFQAQTVTEVTPLVVPRKRDISDRGASELRELINTYPKYSYETAATVERIEAYAKASSEHHGKVITLATDLFPDFYALLNEYKDRVATLPNLNPS
jgi:hypothetical protein